MKAYASLALVGFFAPWWGLNGCASLDATPWEPIERTGERLLGNASCDAVDASGHFLGVLDLRGEVCCSVSQCVPNGALPTHAYCTDDPSLPAQCQPKFIRAHMDSCTHNGAPCVVKPDPACLHGVAHAGVCCPDFCGSYCASSGCSSHLGGESECCSSAIVASALSCTENAAPCVLDADPACENGISKSGVCCAASCGSLCAASGCSGAPGGASNCCSTTIKSAANSCTTHAAPCVLDSDPTCSTGTTSSAGTACCPASCGPQGSCGSSGCSGLPGGANNCCTSKIEVANLSCNDHLPPCVLDQPPPFPFVHPGLLNTQTELERVKSKANAAASSAIKEGWLALKTAVDSSNHPYIDRSPHPHALTTVSGGSRTTDETDFHEDAIGAYAEALAWVITGNQAYANKAIAIFDAWATGPDALREVVSATHQDTQPALESAWVAPMFANAAEILRYYSAGASGWATQTNSSLHQTELMLRYLANMSRGRLYSASNQGVSAALALLSVGVFVNDKGMYDDGIRAWRYLAPIVIDSRGVVNELLDRDCKHAQYSAVGLAQGAEIDFHQGSAANLYDAKLPGESKPRLQQAFEFFSYLIRGGAFAEDKYPHPAPEDNCPGNGWNSYEIPFNHYRWVTPPVVPPGGTLDTEALGSMTDFQNYAAGDGRPDGWDHEFLGWSSATHGDLSRP